MNKYELFFWGILGVLSSMLAAGCSSYPKIDRGIERAGQEQVLSRIDGLSSRPDWLKESQPFIVENGNVYSLGMTAIPIDHRMEAAYRIAENNGKAGISSAIEQRLDFVFQNAEEGTAGNATQAQYIGAEASKLTTNSLRLSKRYWEKVSVVQENGQPLMQYRVFTLVEMPESDFKAALIDAIRKSKGKAGITADFAKKVDQHWDQFVSPDSKNSPAPSRKDASTEE